MIKWSRHLPEVWEARLWHKAQLCHRLFFFKNMPFLLTTLQDVWCYGVSVETGWSSVSISWLGEIAILVSLSIIDLWYTKLSWQVHPWDTICLLLEHWTNKGNKVPHVLPVSDWVWPPDWKKNVIERQPRHQTVGHRVSPVFAMQWDVIFSPCSRQWLHQDRNIA